jgi:hypothetical protein
MEELIDLQTVQQPKSDEIALPEDGTSLTLLQQVYRNPSLPLPTRMRAATAALPHEHPKLAVTTLVNVGDFADQLEKAVERSRKVSPTMIEGNVISTEASDTASNTKTLNGKPTIIDRRYRKW